MNTPVYDYLLKYADSGFLRMHMPGHKGTECMKNLSSVCKYDITEITDAGNLFSGTGIIAESEKMPESSSERREHFIRPAVQRSEFRP